MLPHITFILGGARSGKSKFAESLTKNYQSRRIYCATAENRDEEMKRRIALHQSRRDPDWHLVETPIHLSDSLLKYGKEGNVVLVECLTLWLNNLLVRELSLAQQRAEFIAALPHVKGSLIFVSNEVGLGTVPIHKLARQFQDEAGLLHQELAQIADDVYFVTAGLPLRLKGRRETQ